MNENTQVLEDLVGKEKAEIITQLTHDCEKYILNFKKEMDNLLTEFGYEVKVGLSFHETKEE